MSKPLSHYVVHTDFACAKSNTRLHSSEFDSGASNPKYPKWFNMEDEGNRHWQAFPQKHGYNSIVKIYTILKIKEWTFIVIASYCILTLNVLQGTGCSSQFWFSVDGNQITGDIDHAVGSVGKALTLLMPRWSRQTKGRSGLNPSKAMLGCILRHATYMHATMPQHASTFFKCHFLLIYLEKMIWAPCLPSFGILFHYIIQLWVLSESHKTANWQSWNVAW